MQKIFLTIYSFLLLSLVPLSAQVTFTPSSPVVDCASDTFCIDIGVSNFDSVLSLQFAMTWDESQFTFVEATSTLPAVVSPVVDSVANGQFWFSWIDLSFASISLPDDAVIWKLCFDPVTGGSSDLDLGPVPVAPFILEVNGYLNGSVGPLPYALNSGTVTIGDLENPVVTCPGDTTVYNPGPVNVGGLAPLSLTDNCGVDTTYFEFSGASSGQGPDDASNEMFQVGTTTVTYTAVDDAGNSHTCAFDVTVLDTTTMNSGLLEFIPVVNYDCDNNTIDIEVTVVNFDSISSFAHAVRWDTLELQYTGATQGAIPVNLPQLATNTVYSTFTFLSPPFYTSLPDSSVIYTLSFTPIGTPTSPFISFENLNAFQLILVNDNNGLLTQGVDYIFQNEIFNVIDGTPPTLTNCPTDTIIYTTNTQCGNTHTWTSPTANDACTTVSVDSTHTFGEFFPAGSTTVTYTATDEAGNTATCSFNIIVLDSIPPSITCPANLLLDTDSLKCNAMVTLPAPSTSDNCTVDSTTYVTSNGDSGLYATNVMLPFPTGLSTVTYTAFDNSGNTASCSYTVSVTDNEVPTITCPAPISVNVDPASCDASVDVPAPTVSDNCGIDSITYDIGGTVTTLPPLATSFTNTFPLGMTTVTYTVTDDSGLTATCSFTVTVSDNVVPTISCPADTTVNLTSGTNIVVGDIAATASDNCGTPVIIYGLNGATTTPGPNTDDASGTTFEIGMTTVTYYATDPNGIVDSCSFVVNVTANNLLSITCPTPAPDLDADAPNCSDQVNDIDIIINSDSSNIDSIGYCLTGATVLCNSGNASGETFNVGTTIVTYFVSDIFGNTATCSFEVVMEDKVDPDILCPTLDAFPTDANACIATVNPALILPVSTNDNCGVDSVAYVLTGDLTGSGGLSNLPTIFPIGTTTITYTVSDIYGNTNSCSFNVVVNDTEGPDITCPASVTLNVPAGTIDTVLTGLGLSNVTDLCGIVGDTMYSTDNGMNGNNDISGSAFPVGATIVTYTVLDDSNNSSTCSFSVTVIEDGPTDLIDCPGDQNVCDNDVNIPPIYINMGAIASLTYEANPGSGPIPGEVNGLTLLPGPTVITYTATGTMGNTDVCSFVVNVDNVDPVWTGCPSVPLDLITDPGSCTATANWIIPTPTDNCGIESVTATNFPGTDFPVGIHNIEYIAVDSAGNAAICAFTITVTDGEAPVWDVCPPADVVIVPLGGINCEATVTWTEPTATDLCSSNITYTSTPNSGDIFPVGQTTVIYTATDDSGNTAVCTFNVVVEDTGSPVIDCPDNIVVDADADLCGAIVTWTPATATDDCSNVGISCTHMPGDTFDIGITTVICLAIDALGNDTTCSFTVQVVDNVPPTINDCPSVPILAFVDPGMCGAQIFWPAPAATDDCDTDIDFSSNFEPGDFFPVGTTTVFYTAVDDGDNTVTCSFDVTVEDNEDPVIDCPSNVVIGLGGDIISDPDNIIDTIISINNNCDSVIVFFTEPVASDNCPVFTVDQTGPASGDTLSLGIDTLTYLVTDAYNNTATCSFSIEVQDFNQNITIIASPDDTVCSGSTITLSVDGGPVGASYVWAGPASWTSTDPNPTIPPLNGNFTVVCTTLSGCSAETNIDILFGITPTITASSNSPLCGNGDLELYLDVNLFTAIEWTAPNGDIFTDEDLIISNPGTAYTGIWTVVVTNGECVSTASTEISIGELPPVTINSDCNGALCLGETCTLIGTEVGGVTVTYNWDSNPPGCLPENTTTSSIDVTPPTSGVCEFYYWVSIGDCISEIDTFILSVSGTPVAVDDNYTVEPGDSIVNFAVINNDTFDTNLGYEISLVPPSPEIRGNLVLHDDGTMTYTAPEGFVGSVQFLYELCINCDTENCSTALVTIDVQDESCQVPNVITPNGDEANELLIISCLEGGAFPEAEMQIFNIWGDEVFYAKPYINNWGGTYEGKAGKELPDGTYYYIFKLDGTADADKGHITIFR